MKQTAKKHVLVIHEGLKSYKCMHCREGNVDNYVKERVEQPQTIAQSQTLSRIEIFSVKI